MDVAGVVTFLVKRCFAEKIAIAPFGKAELNSARSFIIEGL
jgi:hypothetical protein